jgi:hypothetical protein
MRRAAGVRVGMWGGGGGVGGNNTQLFDVAEVPNVVKHLALQGPDPKGHGPRLALACHHGGTVHNGGRRGHGGLGLQSTSVLHPRPAESEDRLYGNHCSVFHHFLVLVLAEERNHLTGTGGGGVKSGGRVG